MKVDYSYHYKKWHDDSPANRSAVQRYYQRILAGQLPADFEANLLDVGCGAGLLMLALGEFGYARVQGVDCDSGQVESCRIKGLEVFCRDDTRQFLLERRETFDGIFALDLIEHIPPGDQLDFAEAMWSALKPGGKLICTVPNANSALAGRYRYIDFTHHSSFTEHSLDFLLHNAGFQSIRVQAIEYSSKPRFWWAPLPRNLHWWLFRLVRFWRRLEMVAELGPQQGRPVPLSLNLMAVALKS